VVTGRYKLLGVIAAVVSTVAVTAGCGGSALNSSGGTGDAAPGIDQKTKTVSLGASNALTGPVAVYYNISYGAKAYIDMVNANGGVDGWKFDYKILNDGYEPVRNLENVRNLVQSDHVFALLANQGTTTNTAAAKFLGDTATPVVGPAEGNPALSKYKNYFVLMPNYTNDGAVTATHIVKDRGMKRVGILYEDDESGRPALSGATQALAALGLTPAVEVPFAVGDTNFVPAVSKLQAANVDAVIQWGGNANIASALQAAQQLNFKPQWFTPFYIADPSTIKLAGPGLLEGLTTDSWMQPYSSPDASTKQYRSAMAKYEPQGNIGALSENGWNSAAFFIEGFQRLVRSGQQITQANLMQVMNSIKDATVGTVVDKVSYAPEDHRVGYSAVQSEAFSEFHEAKGGFVLSSPPVSFPSGLNFGG